MVRPILIFGATGQQGGSVVKALLERSNDFLLLCVTRDPSSASAKRILDKSSSVHLVQGDYTDIPQLFANAKSAAGGLDLWGVFLVTVAGKADMERRQGIAVIDEVLKFRSIRHIVFTSSDRGGEQRSWENKTDINHVINKHLIEIYLRDKSNSTIGRDQLGWTILRPVAFMDNIEWGFPAAVSFTSLAAQSGSKPQQWLHASDIGAFAALAFLSPNIWNHRAISIAGDELTWSQADAIAMKVAKKPLPRTNRLVSSFVLHMMTEYYNLVRWIATEGFGADVNECKRLNPQMTTLEEYLRTKSKWAAGSK